MHPHPAALASSTGHPHSFLLPRYILGVTPSSSSLREAAGMPVGPGFSAVFNPRNSQPSIGYDRAASLQSAADLVETPFAEHVGVPVATLAQGRIRLAGFYSLQTAENVLLGWPGAGSLPAGSASLQSHPGVLVPRAEESYGLRLSIQLERESEPGPHNQVLRCLGWVVGVRGCRLN